MQESFSEANSLTHERKCAAFRKVEDFLRSLLGRELGKKDQQVLRCFINETAKAVGIQIAEGKRLAGLSLLNRFLEEQKMPFYIKSREGKKKGVETTWTVREVEENVLDREN